MGFVAAGASIGGTILPITARNLLPHIGYVVPLVNFMFYIFFSHFYQFRLDNAYIRLPATDCAWSCELGEFIASFSLLIGLLKFWSSWNGDSHLLMWMGIFLNWMFSDQRHIRYTVSPLLWPSLVFIPVSSELPVFNHCKSDHRFYLVLTYVGTAAMSVGISSDYAFYLVAIANASSLFGRFCAGGLSDRIGSLNVMIPFTAVAGILTYTWPFARSRVALIAITVVYGYVSKPIFFLYSYRTWCQFPVLAQERIFPSSQTH